MRSGADLLGFPRSFEVDFDVLAREGGAVETKKREGEVGDPREEVSFKNRARLSAFVRSSR